MTNEQVLDKTRAHVRKTMEGEGSGHDWWHIVRVVNNALGIAKKEGGDLFVIELGALLHDIADWKFHNGDSTVGPRVTREWLLGLQVPEDIISQVAYIVEHISFKGGTNKHKMKTLEGKIVQDADRLDAVGAIGVARVFAYGGAHTRPIYDPEQKPLEAFESFEAYQKAMQQSSSLNHFYEKLLRLKDHMNTKAGKAVALKRHAFMEAYLEQFYEEWAGKR